MKDYRVNRHNAAEFIELLNAELLQHGELILTTQPAAIGTWGLAKLWRVWITITHEFMKGNQVRIPTKFAEDGTWLKTRAITVQDTYELFTRCWMGVDEQGRRLSWAKNDKPDQRTATKGERFNCLRQHEQWALLNGIDLYKPRGNEYTALEDQQNG